MDVDENNDNDGSSEGKAGSSDNYENKPNTHNDPKDDNKSDCDSDYSGVRWNRATLKIKDKKPPAPRLCNRKVRAEKKTKRRNGGRVEKRTNRRRRYTRRPATRARARSVSTEDSFRSRSPRPNCKHCGHRCCMRRTKSRESTTVKKVKGKAKTLKKMVSECNQVGSRCAQLSPLFIKSNANPQEPLTGGTVHCESNYPVNTNIDEARDELAEKLYVANLVGIVWALPDDHWRLPTALEKANKLEVSQVTLFWSMYVDTMRPLDIDCESKPKPTRSDSGSGTSSSSNGDSRTTAQVIYDEREYT